MKIIKLHKSDYGHYYVAFDEIPEMTYEKIGSDYVGSATDNNENIVFSEHLKYELPCSVGDTVYFIKAAFTYLPAPKAEKIRKIELYDIDVVFWTESRAFNDRAIGDTIFLTKEEADKALEEQNA